MTCRTLLPSLLLLGAASLTAQSSKEKYASPIPPKDDLPYILHATKLIPTEVSEAKEETRKDVLAYVVPQAASPARTPMAEPIFIVKSAKLDPMKLELYKMDVKGNQREVAVPNSTKKRKDGPRPMHLSVSPLGEGLFRVEVAEPLPNGQYSLTPSGSNQVFCFEVF